MTQITRRHWIALGCAGVALPLAGGAETPREIKWEDLIPPGVPYAEIIGAGDIDVANDTWRPEFDDNATKLNEALDGADIRMPGFIIPLEYSGDGVTEFMLVPYVGACIHTPPPPPNQLVLVKTNAPYPSNDLWAAVWVEGQMRTQLVSTDIAQSGYVLNADNISLYEW